MHVYCHYESKKRGTERIPGDRKLALISAPMFAERKLLVPLAVAEDELSFQAREHLRAPTIAVSQTMAPGIQRTRR